MTPLFVGALVAAPVLAFAAGFLLARRRTRRREALPAWRAWAEAAAEQGRYAEALSAVRRALGVAPEARDLRLHEAWLLARVGRAQEAAEAYAAVGEASPDGMAELLAAMELDEAGDADGAARMVARAIRKSPLLAQEARATMPALARRGDVAPLLEAAERGGAAGEEPGGRLR